MTATADRAGHPDVTEISDLVEGLLSPSRTANVRQHVDTCPSCAETLRSLEEIRELLGAVPAPAAMPADVAERIDAALALEQASAVSGPDDQPAPVSRETSLPASPPTDRPSGHPRARTGPGRGNRAVPDRTARARRRAMALGTVCTVAALGVGVLLVRYETGDGPQAQTAQASSADTFSGEGLESQVDALLGPARSGSAAPFTPESGPDTRGSTGINPFREASVAVPECIRAGLQRNDDALAAEQGTYLGKKAFLVVLPDASNDARVVAYVVDGTCVDHPSVGAGKVLAKRSYARP